MSTLNSLQPVRSIRPLCQRSWCHDDIKAHTGTFFGRIDIVLRLNDKHVIFFWIWTWCVGEDAFLYPSNVRSAWNRHFKCCTVIMETIRITVFHFHLIIINSKDNKSSLSFYFSLQPWLCDHSQQQKRNSLNNTAVCQKWSSVCNHLKKSFWKSQIQITP